MKQLTTLRLLSLLLLTCLLTAGCGLFLDGNDDSSDQPLTDVIWEVRLPDNIASSVDERYLKEALMAMLYHNGKLSGKEAREALGMTRRAFEEVLPRYGFSILVDSEENASIELNA